MFGIITQLFFPERCIGCRAYHTPVCSACVSTIRPAKDIDPGIYALYDYSNRIIRAALWQLKYHHRSGAAALLMHRGVPEIQAYIGELLHGSHPEHIVIVPIPLHRRKLYERGFNQSKLLARVLARAIDSAHVQLLLHKHRFTLPQAKTRSKHERMHNVAHSMEVYGELDKHALYIVLDDVTTTGATLREAMRALRAAGAKKVCGVALAHGYAKQ